jgi:hypothetical protein
MSYLVSGILLYGTPNGLRRGATVIYWEEARKTAKCPTKSTLQTPCNKELPSPKDNRGEVVP